MVDDLRVEERHRAQVLEHARVRLGEERDVDGASASAGM